MNEKNSKKSKSLVIPVTMTKIRNGEPTWTREVEAKIRKSKAHPGLVRFSTVNNNTKRKWLASTLDAKEAMKFGTSRNAKGETVMAKDGETIVFAVAIGSQQFLIRIEEKYMSKIVEEFSL